MAITIVNQSVAGIRYSIFGGSASGISGGGSGAPSGGSGGGSGIVASGIIPSGGTASGISVSGGPAFTVVLDWVTSPRFVVSSAGVVTVRTSQS